MTTVLSHISALEFWRSAMSDAGSARVPCRAKPPLHPPDAREALGIRPFLSLPLHVIALDGRRKDSQNLIVHQARALPDGSLRAIAVNGIEAPLLVVCPELMFVQMAASLGFVRTVHLGYELCGIFAPDKGHPYGARPRKPLTTPDKLAAYIDNAGSLRGIQQARAALPHVLSLSASPRESTLSMLLTLPYKRGGSNIAHPNMNPLIPIGKRNRWTTDRSHFRCDRCGPSKT